MKRLLLAALLLVVALWISFRGPLISRSSAASGILRVAFPYAQPATKYEPCDIRFAPQYVFLHNIYSPLVEYSSEKGDLVGSVADDFKWAGRDLVMHIRNGLKTIDGFPITAQDVEFSLKRLMVLSGNTHGNIKDLLCKGPPLQMVSDPCKGLRVEGENLILTAAKKSLFLLSMLTEIDFAIVPRHSVDPKTLAIVDYRNTSGAFYVSQDDDHGAIVLKANPNHFHYSKIMPQEIHLVPAGIGGAPNSTDLYSQNQVDLITNVDKLNPDQVIAFSRKSDIVIHSTINIRTFLLIFTAQGLQRFSDGQRRGLGKAFREGLRAYFATRPGFEVTDQIFPRFGDGSLSDEQLAEVRKVYAETGLSESEQALSVDVLRIDGVGEMRSTLSKLLPKLALKASMKIPQMEKTGKEMPDAILAAPDTGYLEDIGLISYGMNMGTFGLGRAAGRKWLNSYMKIDDKQDRLAMLNKLHLETLLKGATVPIVNSPYVAAARPGWRIGYSQIFADESLWRLSRE